MEEETVQTGVGYLLRGETVEVLNGPLDELLHEFVVDVGHDLLAEEEADRDEVAVEVLHLAHVVLDVPHHLSEYRHLCDFNTSRWLPGWPLLHARIKYDHQCGHEEDIL